LIIPEATVKFTQAKVVHVHGKGTNGTTGVIAAIICARPQLTPVWHGIVTVERSKEVHECDICMSCSLSWCS
jgi:hypothetical protein